jgi:hypothetical protein
VVLEPDAVPLFFGSGAVGVSQRSASVRGLRIQFCLAQALFTFLYIDFLDTTGTLFSMANFMNNFIPSESVRPPDRPSVYVPTFGHDGRAVADGKLHDNLIPSESVCPPVSHDVGLAGVRRRPCPWPD